MAVKMNRTQIILIIILLVILGLSYVLDSGNGDTLNLINTDKNKEITVFYPIKATYVFENGIHKYNGVIELPTPCYQLKTEAIVKESYPEQVTLEFNIKNTQTSGISCAQVIDKRPFKIIFQASKEAIINAKLNGNPVKLIINKKNEPK